MKGGLIGLENQTPILQMKNIVKRFPGTLAVDNVSIDFYTGEIHALMGENGAGKSTLMKVLAGLYGDYEGDILIDGEPARLKSPFIAIENHIAMIYQELSLAKDLSIAENIFAGRPPKKKNGFIDRKRMDSDTKEILKVVGLDYLNPGFEVSEISLHEAQLVEIARALTKSPKIIVMDEPTSALSREEVERLFGIIRQLKKRGLAIIYISHHIPEIFDIADHVTVMRDGKKVDTSPITDLTPEILVEKMVGQKIDKFYAKREANIGKVIFKVEDLTHWGYFHHVSLELHKGEILGICGLAGAGRTEIARSIIGIEKTDQGSVFLNGNKISNRNMAQALRRGIAYLAEDRKQQGLALRMSLEDNVCSAMLERLAKRGFFSKRAAEMVVNREIERLQIYPREPERMVLNFSGGNQQKILLGKWLALDPEVLILDEPTRGVDVGAKAQIHKVISQLADSGTGIILLSSDLPELVGLCDRVVALHKGRLTRELNDEEINEATLLLAATNS